MAAVSPLYPWIVTLLAVMVVGWALLRPVGSSGEERLAASVTFRVVLVAATLAAAGTWLGWLIYALLS
ncbi:hypothetical protein OPIT5_29345 [Opitutaceae bacterium TAV5]|nr:hypothetical protein OPIT5_29345 [Opitutaceae bacterium TAV5]